MISSRTEVLLDAYVKELSSKQFHRQKYLGFGIIFAVCVRLARSR